MKRLFLVSALLILSSSAFATLNAGTSKISSLLFYEGSNLVYVYLENGVQNAPSCHGSNGDYISFSMTRPMANTYLSALLAAFMAGKDVNFRIEGTCIDQSVSATLSYFEIFD